MILVAMTPTLLSAVFYLQARQVLQPIRHWHYIIERRARIEIAVTASRTSSNIHLTGLAYETKCNHTPPLFAAEQRAGQGVETTVVEIKEGRCNQVVSRRCGQLGCFISFKRI